MNNKIWKKFNEYGSGFKLEGERDYKNNNKMFYHLYTYGFFAPDNPNNKYIGDNIINILKEAIAGFKKEIKRFKKGIKNKSPNEKSKQKID